MRDLKPYKDYKKGLKKLSKSGNKVAQNNLEVALTSLANGTEMPPNLNYHALHGVQKGLFQAHLQGTQWVLVVRPEPSVVHLFCLGSHRECNK